MPIRQHIVTCLWFDDQAEQAAAIYSAIFPNSSIGRITRYSQAGQEIHASWLER